MFEICHTCMNEIKKLIDNVNFRKSNSKDYKKMSIKEISQELRNVIKIE